MRAIKVSTVTALPTNGQWDHLFFTYDGSGRAAGVKIYVNGAPVATKNHLRHACPQDHAHLGAAATGAQISG